MRRTALFALALAATLTASACGGSSATGPSGTSGNFNLRITDDPYGSAQAILITFSEVTVHKSNGDSTKVSFGGSTITCDIKKLENNATDLLGTANLKAGENYTELRFTVSKARIFFDFPSTSPTPCAASITEPAGAAFNVTVPSSTVKMNDHPFTQADGTTTMLVDFHGPGSIVNTGNNSYILTPVFTTKSVE